jgi:ABC-type branched-subunit amino acid transport system substrate-binding protein
MRALLKGKPTFRLAPIVAVAAVLAIAGCASATSSAGGTSGAGGTSDQKFTVLWIGDLSGAAKVYGGQQKIGVSAAASYLNSHGGIDGRQISITYLDDGGNTQTAVSDLIKYLGSHSAPNFVFAGAEGTDTVALIPILAQHHLLSTGSSDGGLCASDAEKSCPTFFEENAPQAVIQGAAAKFLATKGAPVGILEENAAYQESETGPVTAALAGLGVKSDTATFPGTATDVTPEMSQLKADGVKVVYVEALGASAGYAASARARLGWNVPLLFDVGASALDLTTLAPTKELGNAWEQLFAADDPAIQNPGVALIRQQASGGSGLGQFPIRVAGNGWDYLFIVKDGVEAAKSLNPAEVMHALEAQSINDPNLVSYHSVGFTASDHENIDGQASDFPILPVGPYKNGQVVSP